MAQKKIMLLGGLRYLKPVIDAAHKQGYYVITADYLPNNIAHKWSDEYCNVSIIDKEAVLKEAQRLQIDGIMSFACDPGVVAASYVQNKMGLPSFGPFESVEILQNKDKFRAFLAKNGFNVPQAKGFDSVEAAMEEIYWYSWPVIVKPTDAAGSKGVTRVDKAEDLKPALEYAMEHSISGHIIVEEFIDKQGCSSDTDSFSEDGKLKFVSFCAQRFDAEATNPYTPAAYSWPSTFTKEQEEYLTSEIQRLITLLNLKTVVYNIEVRVAPNGKPYIMELTPRGGGNRLCEMLRYATGVDMITAITRAMVGDPILEPIEQKPYNGHWAEIILHADKDGVFDHLEISRDLPAEVVEEDLWVEKGDKVESFEGANNAIGTLVLKFQAAEELEKAITNQRNWLKVVVK
jgi:biotin carboxylase